MQVYNLVFLYERKNNYKENPLEHLFLKRSNWKTVLEDKGNSLDQRKEGAAV